MTERLNWTDLDDSSYVVWLSFMPCTFFSWAINNNYLDFVVGLVFYAFTNMSILEFPLLIRIFSETQTHQEFYPFIFLKCSLTVLLQFGLRTPWQPPQMSYCSPHALPWGLLHLSELPLSQVCSFPGFLPHSGGVSPPVASCHGCEEGRSFKNQPVWRHLSSTLTFV